MRKRRKTMRKWLGAMALAAMAAGLQAADDAGTIRANTLVAKPPSSAAAAELAETASFNTAAKDLKARTVSHTFGENVKVKLTACADEIFGRWTISVVADAENTGKKPLFLSCFVAFQDHNGKLLCAANLKADALKRDEKWRLAPGEKRKIEKLLDVPFKTIGQVHSIHAVLYESEEGLGVKPAK